MQESTHSSVVMKMAAVVVVVVMMVMSVVVPVVQGQDSGFDLGLEAADNVPEMDNWIQRLHNDKLHGYSKNSRPTTDHTKPTVVTLGLSLRNIDLDDQKQEFSVIAWSIMTWKDDFLHWSPKDYTNINKMHFDDDEIWMPDIKLYNSAEGSDVHPFGAVPVLVDYNGLVYWFPPTHMVVKCDLDLKEWPRDQHECQVRMGSWSHHGEQIDIQVLPLNDSNGVMIDVYEKNNRWELLNVTATRTITNTEGHDPYVEVNFTFQVKRQSRTQALYITQSTLAVVVVVLATYILPLDRFFSRLVMHLFSLGVLITCFFTLFALLPANGGPMPTVVRYYSGSIILTTLSLVATLILTTRACCCCCGSSSSSSSFPKSLVNITGNSSRLRRNGISQPSPTSVSPYNTLDLELAMEEDEQQHPRATQLNQGGDSAHTSRYTRLQEEDGRGEGRTAPVDSVTQSQFLSVVNFLLLALFTIAFVVDYVVLRNVTL